MNASTLPFPKPKVRRRSVSQQMYERFRQHKTRRHFVSVLYTVVYLVYLRWRFSILNPDSMVLSLTYFVAECFGFILGLTIILASQNYSHREPLPVLKNRTVDVLLPTYKEPIEMIRRTAMAARDIKYLHGTYLLDDGRREEVRTLAAELGVHYLSRPDNSHAKAGNLNFGLAHSNAEFVLVFDADHIAMPHALEVTLGFFTDDNVAMVQTPQDYYNTDAFQYVNTKNGGLWHDQSFFYNIGQSCRDSVDGASCVGTGAVYRRSALNKVGGIPVETVTEDIHTTLKFHKAGYRIIYLNEPIAYGEAAPDLKEYYKTRQRWGHGNLHALQYENALLCKGLTIKQRIAHISLGLIYLEGWQQLMLFAIPVGTLLFGLQPFQINIFNILVVLLFPFLNYMLLQEIGCGFARFWPNEIFAMARWPVQILATVGALGRTMPWRTSLKNFKARVHWHLMIPQLTVMAISLGALTYAIFRVHGDYETGPLLAAIQSIFHHGVNAQVDFFTPMPRGYTVDMVMISGFWALYNAVRAGAFVIKVLRNARRSHQFFRFAVPLPLHMKGGAYGRVREISETWAGFTLLGTDAHYAPGEEIAFTLFLPAGPLEVRMAVENCRNHPSSHTTDIEGTLLWGTNPQPRDRLANALYSVDWHREFLNRQAYFLTPLDIITACVTFRLPPEYNRSRRHWQPVLYYGANDKDIPTQYGVIANDTRPSLITFTQLQPGQRYMGIIMEEHAAKNFEFISGNEEPVASLVQEGLDQAVVRRFHVYTTPVTEKSLDTKTLRPTALDTAIPIAI